MIRKCISLTVIFSMLSIDLVRAMESDEEQGNLQRRLSPAIMANEEEPHEQGVLIKVDENPDEQTPLLDQFRSRSDGEEKDLEEGGEEETEIPSDPSKLKGVNALKSILIADLQAEHPEAEHLEDEHSENEDSMSPESHVYLLLGEREVPDLIAARERLQQIENRSSFLKWSYWDNTFNKMTYAVWLRQNDMTSMPAKGCCPGRPLWIDGDGLPLVTGFSAARRLTGFYEGTAAFTDFAMEIILYGLMGYEMYEQSQDNQNFQALKVLEVIWNGDSQSIKGILSFFASPEYTTYSRYCLSIFVLPLLWGLQESFFFARVNLHETPGSFKKAIQIVRKFSFPENKRGFFSSLWKDYIRWRFPHYGIESAVDYLLYSLLLDGNLPIQDRKVAFAALIDFPRNVSGYAKIKGLETLEKIAHGISLKQFDIIEQNYGKEYKEALLTEKAWALDELKKYNPGIRKAGIKGFFTNLYAHYLLWKMGDFGHPVSVAALTLYKVGKLALTINFMVQIGRQIAEFLYCPNPLKQGVNAAMQPTGGYSTYNQQCFNAYLSVFNRIPDQPACTLVNLMPNFILAKNFTLFNLSGAGASGEQIAGLLMGFRQYQPNISLTQFDLSGNAINTVSGMTALFKAFQNISLSNPPSKGIQMLNLSNNFIGNTDDNSTLVLGHNLQALTQLETLDLSDNSIGGWADDGTQAIGESLQYLTNLRILDFSNNHIGNQGDNGTQAIGENLQHLISLQVLDLSNNLRIGSEGDNGTIAIGESLQYLSQLQTLDLSWNFIGLQGNNGTQAIGKNLQYLTGLQTLDLSNNLIGHGGDTGTQAIGEGLQYLTQLKALDLSMNYMISGFVNITNAILSLNKLQSLYVQQINVISPPPTQIDLLKQFWNYRNNNTDVYALITEQDIKAYLNPLPNATQTINLSRNFPNPSDKLVTLLFNGMRRFQNLQTLDLSNNWIGLQRDTGIQLIGENLQYFPQLQALNLSYNNIGPYSDKGTQDIGKNLQYLTQLKTLDFSINGIGNIADNGTQAIGESLQYLNQLQTLDLSGNAIGYTGDNGTQAIGENLKYLTKLQTLGLSTNWIGYTGDNGTQAMGVSFQYLTELQTLDLSYNFIGSQGNSGIQAIGNSLPSLANLQALDLSNNSIGGIGAQSLFNVLPQVICHGLQTLNLQFNNFTSIPWSQAASALEGQYSGQIHQACEANRCFGTPITQNKTAIQCNAMQNLNNQLIPLEQENCPIPIAGASSLSPPIMMSLFMMSQRSGVPLVFLSLWLLTFNLFADYS